MQFPNLALALALAAIALPTLAQVPGARAPLSLAEALRLAEAGHPALLGREAQLAAAEGLRREAASRFFNNPELSTEQTRRRAAPPDGSRHEWGVGVAQPIETGGQQARRREAAAAGLDALRAEIDDARRQARADAAARFHAVLAAQARVQIEQRSVELFDGTAQAVARRRAAGEDTRLDANVALVEAERARNTLALARERLIEARGELANALRQPAATLPELAGALDAEIAGAPPYGVEQLVASAQALARHRALAAREDVARARLGVERASRSPDVTVGLSLGREGPGDARERVTTVSVSVPLPLFKHNDAAIGQALADLAQAGIERATAQRESQARVRQLWSRLQSQRERVMRLQRVMLPATTDNRQLSLKSRQAGQIGLLEQLVVNRQALDAERELNEVLTDLHATRIELEYTAGWLEGSAP